MKILNWQQWPLIYKSVTMITALIALSVLTTSVLAIRREYSSFHNEHQEQAELLLTSFAIASQDYLYYLDTDRLDDILAGLGISEVPISFGRVFDGEGRIIADSHDIKLAFQGEADPFGKLLLESDGTLFDWQPDLLLAGKPVKVGRQILGAVAVGLPTAPLAAKINAMRTQGLISALGASLVGMLIAIFVSRTFTDPIQEMAIEARRISLGDLDTRVTVQTGGEIGQLALAMNIMADKIQSAIEEIGRGARVLEVSRQIGRRVSMNIAQKELAQLAVDQLQIAFDYYHVHIYLFDEIKENLTLVSATGEAGKQMLDDGHCILKGEGLVGRCATTNEAVIAADISDDIDFLPNSRLPDTKAEIAIPISCGNEVFGVLDVQYDEIGGMNRTDVELLMAVANTISLALARLRTAKSERRNAEELAVLLDLSQKLSQELDFERILEETYQAVSRLFDTSNFYIALIDHENQAVSFPIIIHDSVRGPETLKTITPTTGLTEHIIQTKAPILIKDNLREWERVNNVEIGEEPPVSWLGVPLLISNEIIGVMGIQDFINPYVYDEHDLEVLTTVANQAAAALQNARSIQDVKNHAQREALIAEIGRRIQSTTGVEDALKVTVRELSHALGKDTFAQLIPEEDKLSARIND